MMKTKDNKQMADIFDNNTTGILVTEARFPANDAAVAAGGVFRDIIIKGGVGGKGKANASKERCNAIMEMATLFVEKLSWVDCIGRMSGGSSVDDIPTECKVSVCLQKEDVEKLMAAVAEFQAELSGRYGETEPGVDVAVSDAEAFSCALGNAPYALRAIYNLPCGAIDVDDDGVKVVACNNIATLSVEDGGVIALACQLWSSNKETMMMRTWQIGQMLSHAYAKVEVKE